MELTTKISPTTRTRGRPHAHAEIDLSKVLLSAIEIFAHSGYSGAQLQVIAKKSGISNSMISYYFKGKKDLWMRSMIMLSDQLIDRFKKIQAFLKDVEGVYAAKAFTRQFVYFSAENPEFFKILSQEIYTDSWRTDWLIDNVLNPIKSYADEIMISDMSNQVSYPPANLISILIGAANVHFTHAIPVRRQYGVNPYDKEEIERHADILVSMIFGQKISADS